jgi:arylsulfatase A-like enzyme
MRAVFVLFDSLNRLALGCYGGSWIATPNFDRFARRAVTFDKHYVGSLPCMPARRDMHTGRLNFMHRSWGPLEPFDNSLPQILDEHRVHAHLVSDHLHYFEDGGATYHTRYTTWDFIRGQEYDPWKAMVKPPVERYRERYSQKHYDFGASRKRLQHAVNADFMLQEKDYPGPQCMAAGLEFLERNRDAEDWLLHIECFDPHEPFMAPERFKQPYRTGYNGGILDWPHYEKIKDSPEEIAEIRANYAALVAMCDHYFGQLLDFFDATDMWSDTMLVLTTDHGFLLAEHDWWGKNRQPYYEEISHIPLIVHHPAHSGEVGRRVASLAQTIDLMPTFLDAFGCEVPPEVRGRSLLPCLSGSERPRDGVAFGMFGGPVGVTDGRYAYYLYPDDLMAPGLGEYTLMPMHLHTLFTADEIRTAQLTKPFDFTKDMPLMRMDALKDARRIPIHDGVGFEDTGSKLFDLAADPEQECPLDDPATAARMQAIIAGIFAAHDAPSELYGRMNLEAPAEARAEASGQGA